MKSWWIVPIRIWTLAAWLLAPAGCAEPVSEPSAASLDAIRALPREQRVAALLELEKESPESARVQLELGLAYGTAEQFVTSERHFRAAYEGAGRDRELRGQAILGLANAHLGQGELREALDAAAEGGPESVEPSLALLRARAHFLMEEPAYSAAAYDEIWDPDWDALAQTDFVQYSGALLAGGNFEGADEVLTASLRRYGYTSGMGFQLSAAAEAAGRQSDSVLYAFLDSFHGVAIGTITAPRLRENLLLLREGLGEFESAMRALDYALAIADGDWGNAAELQAGLRFGEAAEVLPAIVGVSNSPEDAALRESALDLLPGFTAYAPLYDALIRTLRNDDDYRFASMRSILETAIVIAADGPAGRAARSEMGRLLNFNADETRRLLTNTEIAALGNAAAGGSALDPTLGAILAVLGLPEHPYTQTALAAVMQLMRLPRIREYVRSWIPGAPPEARRRVETLL